MCAAALNVLGQDPEGLVLMVEGGAVDWANHANQTGRMMEEMNDFNDAVAEVIAWIEQHGGWSQNLLIVTGDHETGYLMGPAGPDGKAGREIVNAGAGTVPGVGWYSTGHTNSLIPVFANGDAAELLRKYADEQDPVRGYYVETRSGQGHVRGNQAAAVGRSGVVGRDVDGAPLMGAVVVSRTTGILPHYC